MAAALSEDALNRYRIAHSDRDLRPLLRRIHRLSRPSDDPVESELVRLESLKWRAGVLKTLESATSWDRQATAYDLRTQETVNRTDELKKVLHDEQGLLKHMLEERDHMVRCDAVAALISARGKSKRELDEEIAELETSVAEHTTSHAAYLAAVQTRSETFGRIVALVEECRAEKLPLDADEGEVSMDVDVTAVSTLAPSSASTLASTSASTSASASAPAPRLSPQALVFQPTPAQPTPSSPLSKPAHPLPTRPSRSASATPATTPAAAHPRTTHALPTRPSGLRSATVPPSLEEGEVGGEEEGEVSEGGKRKAAGGTGRNSRARN